MSWELNRQAKPWGYVWNEAKGRVQRTGVRERCRGRWDMMDPVRVLKKQKGESSPYTHSSLHFKNTSLSHITIHCILNYPGVCDNIWGNLPHQSDGIWGKQEKRGNYFFQPSHSALATFGHISWQLLSLLLFTIHPSILQDPALLFPHLSCFPWPASLPYR